MKKYIALPFMLFMCCISVNAIGNRIVEIGVDTDIGATNSFFSISDLLFNESKTISFDLNKLTKASISNGFLIHADAKANVFFNLNFGTKFSMGVFAQADSDVSMCIPSQLIDLIANGNTIGKTQDDSFEVKASVFASAGISTAFKLSKFRISLRPAMFIPLVYAREGSAHYSFIAQADGTVSAETKYEIPVYSVFDLDQMSLSDFPLDDIFSIGGIDLTASIDYEISSRIVLNTTFENIPLKAAHADYQLKYSGSADFLMDPLLSADDDDPVSSNSTKYNKTSVQSGINKKISRPFKVAFSAKLTPFRTNRITVIPDYAFVFENGHIDHADFGVTGILNFTNMLKTAVYVLRRCDSWKTGVSASINLRIIELNINVGTYFPTIAKMFSGTGLSAGVGFRIGY